MAKASNLDALRKAASDAYEAWAQAAAQVDEAEAQADETADEAAPAPAGEPPAA